MWLHAKPSKYSILWITLQHLHNRIQVAKH